MAYRLADWERWQQMDFVVGISIQLSNNHTCLGKDGEPHPFHDICDELEGEYPKTFKWVGWHPQCRCNAVPILKTVDEKIADNMAKRNGQAPAKESVNSVKRMPKAFTDWIKDNKNRIAAAKSQPYFIRDNATEVSKIIPGVLPESMMPATPVLSIAERAQMRHDARTPEQIADIRRRWIFHEAKLRHEARTPEQAEAIRSEYYGRKAIRHYGENILRYKDGIKDVDTSKLRSLLSGGDVESIMAEARKLRDAGKQILGLTYLENPMQTAKQFSMQKAVEVNEAVSKKLAGWSNLSLADQKKKLAFEIKWIEENKKYETWEAAQKAYVKQLLRVEHRIEMAAVHETIKREIDLLNASKSSIGKQLVSEFKNLLEDDSADLQKLRVLSDEIKSKAIGIEKNRIRNTVSKKVEQSSIVQTDDEMRTDFVSYAKSIGVNINPKDVVIDKGFVHLQGIQHEKLYRALKIENAQERAQLWAHKNLVGTHNNMGGYVRTGNSFLINKYFRKSKVVGQIDSKAAVRLNLYGANTDDIKTIKLLDKKISEFSTPIPLRVTRYLRKGLYPRYSGKI